LAPTVALGRFDLVVDLSESVRERFETIVASTGASMARTARVSPGDPNGLRLQWTSSIVTKMAVAVSLGAAAYSIGAPVVTVASCLMGLALVARATETVAREVRVERPALEAVLGMLGRSAVAEVRRARARLTDADTLERSFACIREVAEIVWLTGGDAVHLPHLDVERVRSTLARVVSQTLKIAFVADTLRTAGSDSDVKRSGKAYETALAQLAGTEARLTELRSQVVDGLRAHVAREAPAEPLHLVQQVQREVDQAVAIAEALYGIDADRVT
jgi:hypothetical protein